MNKIIRECSHSSLATHLKEKSLELLSNFTNVPVHLAQGRKIENLHRNGCFYTLQKKKACNFFPVAFSRNVFQFFGFVNNGWHGAAPYMKSKMSQRSTSERCMMFCEPGIKASACLSHISIAEGEGFFFLNFIIHALSLRKASDTRWHRFPRSWYLPFPGCSGETWYHRGMFFLVKESDMGAPCLAVTFLRLWPTVRNDRRLFSSP